MSSANETGIIPFIGALLVSMIFFAFLIIYVAKNPKKRSTPVKISFVIMFIGGMSMYCIFHYQSIKLVISGKSENSELAWVKNENSSWLHIPYVIIRTVMDVGLMFYGRDNRSVFYRLPISKYPSAVFFFWLMHLIAFYTAATALLIRFGNDLLRWIIIVTSKISDVDLIYGINKNSIVLGRNIPGARKNMLVYVDNVVGDDYETSIRDLGGVIYATRDALSATESFFRDIRVKPDKTKFRLFAVSTEFDKNLDYARKTLKTLQSMNIKPEQTELVLLGTEEWKGMFFQSSDSQYGYGTVTSFEEYTLGAYLLMHEYPLCNAIKFDENWRAVEDMNVLIIGFGRIGHEVLRKVIANGQFEGSNFHAVVYDPNVESRTGFIKSQYPSMFNNYDISFVPHNGRSEKIFGFIHDNASKLKYIVICLDDRDVARDIAVHIVDRLETLGYSLNVYTCDTKGIRCYSRNAEECKTHWIYDSKLLFSGELDNYAMELNHRYTGGTDKEEDWKKCGYFGRMSSRASVDYLVPFIKKIRNESQTNELTYEQRENLAKSEHLRWCAFHYTSGYEVMKKEEFIKRIKDYLNETEKFGKSKIKINKDAEEMKHVCLVGWDELDEISSIENSLTHNNKNYKDSDRVNVDMIMGIINSEEKADSEN